MIVTKIALKLVGWSAIIIGLFLTVRMHLNSISYPSYLPYATVGIGIILLLLVKIIKNINRLILISILLALTYVGILLI